MMKVLAFLSVALAVAAADGVETARWQGEIDAAASRGGGVVTIPAGRHSVGQLELKSNVELRLAEGAVLEGAYGMGFYRPRTLPFSEGVWTAVVSAIGVTNVAVTGKGVIDGRGALWPQPNVRIPNNEGHRPRGLLFADCRGVRLEGFLLRDAASWGVVFKRCDTVVARNVRIDSHANLNNDGFDIEACHVLIEDCEVDSGDDAYCVKSNDPDFTVGDIVIRNCIGRTHSNCYKLGTATHGTVRGLRIESCTAGLPTRDFISTDPNCNFGKPYFHRDAYSSIYTNGVGKTALAIQNVDGGDVSDVIVDGFGFEGYLVPFCIRGGRRQGRANGIPPNSLCRFHDITISRLRGTAIATNASWIVGVDGCRVKNVRLEDVEIRCVGSGRAEMPVMEPDEGRAGDYPAALMFADLRLPSYGLYIDKADAVTLSNVRFPLISGTEEVRPAVYDSRTDAVIAGLVEPPDTGRKGRNLKGNPVWEARFRTLKSVADGTTQPFYWYDPGADEPVPLLVSLHSWGASCRWSALAVRTAAYCETNGWAFAYPNYRGPNVRPEACGSELAVQDVLDVIDWAKKERKIDSDRVYIIGGSGGGHMTLLMAGRYPKVFAGAAAFCPISDLARWYGDSLQRKNHYADNISAVCGGTPLERLTECQRRSGLTYLCDARANGLPVYIVTGIHDGHAGSVPVGHSIRAFNALANGKDRVPEEDITYIEQNECVPERLRFKGKDPFYNDKRRIHLRLTSANARLTVFEGGHAGNPAAGLDFLSRQRRGRKADMSLPERGDDSSFEHITK